MKKKAFLTEKISWNRTCKWMNVKAKRKLKQTFE